MTEKEKALNGLNFMIEEAKEKGLWLRSKYQGIWFHPEDLRQHNEKGNFIWGAGNWDLKDPKEKTKELESEIHKAEERLINWKYELKKWGLE
jgi:hypothetical protein